VLSQGSRSSVRLIEEVPAGSSESSSWFAEKVPSGSSKGSAGSSEGSSRIIEKFRALRHKVPSESPKGFDRLDEKFCPYGISGSGRPLRFELWGAHGDLSPTDSRFFGSQEI